MLSAVALCQHDMVEWRIGCCQSESRPHQRKCRHCSLPYVTACYHSGVWTRSQTDAGRRRYIWLDYMPGQVWWMDAVEWPLQVTTPGLCWL